MTQSASSLTRAARLDRLPVTRERGRLVLGSGLGWGLPERRGETLEAVDADVTEAVAAPTG